jgi:RNA polymerase primary sigma factor
MSRPRLPDDEPSLSELAVLTDRERKLIESRFGLRRDGPKTLLEVGQEFGIGHERARQIQQAALRKIRRSRDSR